jgi:hypothetical protein
VNITVRNAYGEAPAPVIGSPAGNQASSAGRSTAGKSTITMPIINGITKRQRMALRVSLSCSVNFVHLFSITFGHVNKFNPQKADLTVLYHKLYGHSNKKLLAIIELEERERATEETSNQNLINIVPSLENSFCLREKDKKFMPASSILHAMNFAMCTEAFQINSWLAYARVVTAKVALFRTFGIIAFKSTALCADSTG